MQPLNVLVLMSDQHNRKVLGCAGHPVVRTPHLDRLAARGTRFTDAYCNSPICVPSRASFATGRYPHQIEYWDNATPYDGKVPSWGHRLRAAGHHTESIGKLHFRNAEDDTGFAVQQVPMHVLDGIGDLLGLIRDELPRRAKNRGSIQNAGPGESTYTAYDRDITARTVRWLTEEAPRHADKPWVLFSSLVAPHPPMTAPEDFYALYPHDRVPFPPQGRVEEWPMHPAVAAFRTALRLDTPFDEATVRKAVATYLAQTSFLDHNIGQILDALDAAGLAENTLVLYTSDHGDNLGTHGLWAKTTMYEDSAGVPLILAGPGVPAGQVLETPVTLVDVYPTLMEVTGVPAHPLDYDLPGQSLLEIASSAPDPQRPVFAEYHAWGTRAGTFLVRKGPLKYIHHLGLPPQLFDVKADPDELHDLAEDPAQAPVLAECERLLRSFCDLEEADARAKAQQAEKIAAHGGKAAILAKGSVGATPAPGETPVWETA